VRLDACGLVRRGHCAEVLADPSDTPAEQRIPCPHRGAKRRTFELSGTVAVGSDVAVTVSAATARASAPQPTVVIGKLEDGGFDLQSQRLSKDGAWMIWVFDRQGTFVDGSIQDDPQDALLAVCERLYRRKNRPSNRMNPAVAIIVGLEKIRAALGASLLDSRVTAS
jgi:hypothetical protein